MPRRTVRTPAVVAVFGLLLLGACSTQSNGLEPSEAPPAEGLPWVAFVAEGQSTPWARLPVTLSVGPGVPESYQVVVGEEKRTISSSQALASEIAGEDGHLMMTVSASPGPSSTSTGDPFGESSMTILFPPCLSITLGASTRAITNVSWSSVAIEIDGAPALSLLPGESTTASSGPSPWTIRIRSSIDCRRLPAIRPASEARCRDDVFLRTLHVLADERGHVPLGSAALLSPKMALTAAHVAGDSRSVVVEDRHGRRLLARVVRTDPERDVAALEFETPMNEFASTPLLGRDLRAGDEVWLWVHYAAGELLTCARAVGPREILNPAWPGTSGSGAYVLEDGELKLAGVVIEHHCAGEGIVKGASNVAFRGCAACRGTTVISPVRDIDEGDRNR